MTDRHHLPTHSLLGESRGHSAGQQDDETVTVTDSERPVTGINWDKENGFTLFNVISFVSFLIIFSFFVGLSV